MHRCNYIIPSDNWEQQPVVFLRTPYQYYIIPSDNWEQQLSSISLSAFCYYIIPSDNWEQQLLSFLISFLVYYIIPSDNWEQQLLQEKTSGSPHYIIPSDNWEQQLPGAHADCFSFFSGSGCVTVTVTFTPSRWDIISASVSKKRWALNVPCTSIPAPSFIRTAAQFSVPCPLQILCPA